MKKNNMKNAKTTHGFTLIELLVSMMLGIFLVGGVAGMYLETRKNMTQDDEIARLQENARYVIELLRHEIASSGFLGGLNDTGTIAAQAIATECAAGGINWALNVSTVMEMVNDYPGSVTPQTSAGTQFQCLDPTLMQTNSDIISVKRTADTPTLRNGSYPSSETEDLNQWYLKTFDFAEYSWEYLTAAIPSDEATAGSTYDYWEYYVKIYFLRNYAETVGDGIPTFCESYLLGSDMDDRCLVEGVEEMHFEIGVDADGDDVAEQYISNPTSDNMDNAVSVRVHVLMRSINEIVGYTNDKSYSLGARSIGAYNDGYIRKVFTTTIKLRNNLNT